MTSLVVVLPSKIFLKSICCSGAFAHHCDAEEGGSVGAATIFAMVAFSDAPCALAPPMIVMQTSMWRVYSMIMSDGYVVWEGSLLTCAKGRRRCSPRTSPSRFFSFDAPSPLIVLPLPPLWSPLWSFRSTSTAGAASLSLFVEVEPFFSEAVGAGIA